MLSHYCRKKKRLYLEGPFTSKHEVYSVYLKKYHEDKIQNPVSRSFFSKFMKTKNVSIFQLRKDLCDICSSYKVNQVSGNEYQNHLE